MKALELVYIFVSYYKALLPRSVASVSEIPFNSEYNGLLRSLLQFSSYEILYSLLPLKFDAFFIAEVAV